MAYPENCIVKKGYFPDTTKDIDEYFAFVSIDTDLYEPIYQGLCWFYPRLLRGGYIFVHDYNCAQYRGVKEAVVRFSRENSAPFFPLSDSGGSAVFMK
jgi:O-methyltransferase